jgi:hypothetical protein
MANSSGPGAPLSPTVSNNGNDNGTPVGDFSNPYDANPGNLLQGTEEPGQERVEPILDADTFRRRFLKGLPTVSAFTGEDMVADEDLKDFISGAISEFESSVRIPVTPVRITDRFDFQRADDLQFGTKQLTRWPVLQVEELRALFPGRLDPRNMTPGPQQNQQGGPAQNSSEEVLYPTSWVVPDGDCGLIRIVPNSGSLVNADISFIASTGYRSILLGGLKQWPDLWRIQYKAGFDFAAVPWIVNKLIGTIAAIEWMQRMGPLIFPANSYSTSVDGLSQGTATAGPLFLQTRIQGLIADRDRLIPQLRAHYGTDLLFAAF